MSTDTALRIVLTVMAVMTASFTAGQILGSIFPGGLLLAGALYMFSAALLWRPTAERQFA